MSANRDDEPIMSFDTELRRKFWIVPLPLLALVAFLNAQAVAALVGVPMGLDAAQLAQPQSALRGGASSAPTARRVNAKAILERNPFDHVTGSLVKPETDATAATGNAPVAAGDPWSAPTCEGVDVSALIVSDDIDWSFAGVIGSDKKTSLQRRGGEVAGKTVYFIGLDRIWLSGNGGLCQAILFDARKAPPPPPPVASSAPKTPRSRAAALDPALRKGIQAVSATEFNIDRGVVDKILENQAELMRQARVIPVQQNGRVVGIRMMGVRPDSLLGVLGMKNNDQLQTINGFEVANPEKALEAYARLRTADKLTIQLNRDGKAVNLDYNIK